MANFTQSPHEWTPEGLKALSEALNQQPTAFDRFNALFDHPEDLTPVRQVARSTGRVTETRIHEPGDVITLDGERKYQVDDAGRWIRIN